MLKQRDRLEKWVTVQEVAEECEVTSRTAQYWVEKNWIPSQRIGPRLFRVRKKDLKKLLKEIQRLRQKFSEFGNLNNQRIGLIVKKCQYPSLKKTSYAVRGESNPLG